MATSHAAGKKRAAARAAADSQARLARRRSRRRLLLAVTLAAVGIVAAFIGFQAFSGGSDKVPERVATGEGRVLGDPNAPVTVVEYADFQCPVCKRAESSIVSKIEEDYIVDGQVKLEFRMFPIIGDESYWAAQAAEAARDQGKFWEYHNALFNAQGRENSGAFSYDRLVALAKDVGLDVPTFEQTLQDNTHLDAIKAEAKAASDAGVSSTPTFYVNGKKIVGAQSYDVFQKAIAEALDKAAAQSETAAQ